QAIDQAYAKNVQNDDIRMMYVVKERANPKHPLHQFGMGNSKTLAKVSQQTLINWYQKHYSSNLMRLIVYSRLPLDELTLAVVEDFSGIVNKNIQPLASIKEPISQIKEKEMVYIEPVKNIRTITLLWNLPEKFASALDEQPESYVCYILGNEGEKSLLAELKKMHLADALGCGSFKYGPGNQVFFLDIELTEEGIKSVDVVIKKAFSAIDALKKSNFPRHIFDEVSKTARMKYRYKTRENLFETIMKDAMKVPYEKMETYPEHSKITQTFDPKLIEELVNFLTPENAEFYLVAPSALTGIAPTKEEKWIGAKYSVKPILPLVIKEWSQAEAVPEIGLPEKNPFIPQNLGSSSLSAIQDGDTIIIPVPELLLDSEKGKIYFAKDSTFGTPDGYLFFEIKTPEIRSGNAASTVFADLYVKALKDLLNKFSYPATTAGLNYEIQRTDNGISIMLDGFGENAPLLFQGIVNQLSFKNISKEKFEIFKEALFREYQNAYKSSPIKAAIDTMKSALYKHYTPEKEKEKAIEQLTYEAFQAKLFNLFKQSYIEGMIFGNIEKQEAVQIKEMLLNALPGKPYLSANQLKREVIVLPDHEGPFYLQRKVDVQGNALILLVEGSGFSLSERAAQQILMQAMSSPFFSTLRTKQQTGYLVDSTDQEIEKQLFNLFVIQSNTHDPKSLLERVELFIEGYMQELGQTNITEENFELLKESIVHTLENSYNNSKSMGELLKNLAFKYDGDFDWMNKRIHAFHTLSYEQFLNLSRDFFSKGNKRRLGILIDGLIPEENSLHYIKVQTLKQLRKLSSYSNGKML
ncbi:MAG TPA: insulinase family protein, partial [Parachlamydiaceae bacterium]|nr:insulinase family protein [Parachlamydiaceae bacterium]